ncbi:uncharacterized protein LOC124861468 [Girardinichthys multiradiatus]|uniref:uncharacterized protein LOC124861468 n=1 Tax=Girardinichthys multiradiatus TaxID=208333 RepID=UPI001FACAEE1|nr:uncharacterized protein LOC124861468 [Girardinichthys multiradiatus]
MNSGKKSSSLRNIWSKKLEGSRSSNSGRTQQRKRHQMMDDVFQPRLVLPADVKEEAPEEQSPDVDQQEPKPLQIKEEQEELWTSQEGEQLNVKEETDTRFPLTAAPIKSALDEALEYIKELEARLEKVDLSPTLFSRYCVSDDQIRFYTKFPSESVVRIYWESIASSASRLVYWTRAPKIGNEAFSEPRPARSMPLIDEFLMDSFRVAVGMKEQLIADMFQVSIATVSRVTITWANYLFIVFSSINIWISREKVKASMPRRFLKFSPNVRVVLDGTEVALETPSSLTLQSETFSAYQNRTTLKGLIRVAPCGLMTFVSALYAGCISDKEITKVSGVLPLLEPADEVMADKVFLIQDLLDEVGAKLIIPPFKHPGQFSEKETEQTQAIARLRIIVERAIARVKRYHIWDAPVPLTLIGTVNQIWFNCCFLANYQKTKSFMHVNCCSEINY